MIKVSDRAPFIADEDLFDSVCARAKTVGEPCRVVSASVSMLVMQCHATREEGGCAWRQYIAVVDFWAGCARYRLLGRMRSVCVTQK